MWLFDERKGARRRYTVAAVHATANDRTMDLEFKMGFARNKKDGVPWDRGVWDNAQAKAARAEIAARKVRTLQIAHSRGPAAALHEPGYP